MKKLLFMLLFAATIATGAQASTPAATVPAAIQTSFAFTAADEAQIKDNAFAQEVDAMAPMPLKKWLRGLIHVIRIAIDWIDDTLPPAMAINNTNDGDSGPGSIGVDLAAWDPAQAPGLDLNGNILIANQEVAVYETDKKIVYLMPGQYPLDPNGEGPAQYVIHDKQSN